MELGDWITLSAVLVALGIGVASILHTQSLQKRERRERLLNEIIEWAKQSYELFYDLQGVYPGSEESLDTRRLEKSLTLHGQKRTL
ncbi:hypothetical protein ACFLW6_01110 [Chloroflexota bacterium]